MSQYLGDISAYALAVSQGYTGTEEEYAELMASYATVGQTAVNAAQTATTKASEAATSATTATNKASEATTAATTATTKAGEASTSASTATSAKDTAVSASQTATTKATEATTAAATATSAKTDAVAANTAAQSAKTAAQTAKTAAETAAASVSASAEQIATNAADISQLKSEITDKSDTADMLKAFPTDTASGSVASFADGANVPVKSLVVNIDPVQSGSGDPSPDNVRPISGWSEVNTIHAGANVFDENAFAQYGATKQSDGSWLTTNLYQFYGKVVYAPPTGYTGQLAVTFKRKTESGKQSLRLIINYTDGTNVTLGFSNATGNWDTYTLVTDGSKTVANIKYDYGSGVATYFNLLIAFATTVTPYEPYSGQSITIALGQTVYGGTLDVTKGELVIDRALTTLNTFVWSEYIAPSGNIAYPYLQASMPDNAKSAISGTIQIACSAYKCVTSSQVAKQGYDKTIAQGGAQLFVSDSAYSDRASFLAGIADVQLIYMLANPTTIQLTPHGVRSLLGSNNIWADTGDSTVTYRADPTLYISRLTEPDADMVADSNITSGQYFMVGNTLYKATANIASGATISPNVNCTRKSLSEALNEINA